MKQNKEGIVLGYKINSPAGISLCLFNVVADSSNVSN